MSCGELTARHTSIRWYRTVSWYIKASCWKSPSSVVGRFGLESHKYGVFAHCTDIGSNNSESIVCRRQHRHSVGLRNCVQHFDFHTPPPIVRDEQYTSVRSMCVNEKKVQDRGSNSEPGARGIANPTERNGHPKTHPPNPRVGHPRCDSILLPSELQEWDADQQCVHQNQE